MKLPFFLLALLLCPLGPPTLADTSSEMELPKRYGNCGVWTILDRSTDEAVHIFACYEDVAQIVIGSKSGSLEIALRKGGQLHTEWSIPVTIRIDKGPLIKRNAEWDPEGAKDAIIYDNQLARQLLHELAQGQRVAIQVGDERGHIQLDGSQRAVADFRQRVGFPAQQTLTPQERQVLRDPAQADTSSSSVLKNEQSYGNCSVFTGLYMRAFTDEEPHSLICGEQHTSTDETMIIIEWKPNGFGRRPKGFSLLLSKGVQVHTERSIPVTIRIDDGPIIERNAGWDPEGAEHASIDDQQLTRQLLHDLAHGQRVAIQVGDERGRIQLDGSQRAVADFRQRVGLPAQ